MEKVSFVVENSSISETGQDMTKVTIENK